MPMPFANPEAISDLIRWDVPFATGLWPSVGVITECDTSKVVLVVRLDGFGKYPQFLVRFWDVVLLLEYEETCAIDRGFRNLIRSEFELCAYHWITSPWLKEYRVLEDILFTKSSEKLHHYILLGGDSIVEVIALGEPQVERVDKKMFIDVKHEV
jgi:hypothetical protein